MKIFEKFWNLHFSLFYSALQITKIKKYYYVIAKNEENVKFVLCFFVAVDIYEDYQIRSIFQGWGKIDWSKKNFILRSNWMSRKWNNVRDWSNDRSNNFTSLFQRSEKSLLPKMRFTNYRSVWKFLLSKCLLKQTHLMWAHFTYELKLKIVSRTEENDTMLNLRLLPICCYEFWDFNQASIVNLSEISFILKNSTDYKLVIT